MDEKENKANDLKGLGNESFFRKDFDSAIKDFSSYLESCPNDHYILTRMGQIYREKRDFITAKSFFQRALEIKADDSVALYGLADVLREEGDLDKSLELSRKAVSLDDNNPWTHYNLALIFKACKDFSEAEKECMRALDFLPQNNDFLAELSIILAEAGKPEDSLAVYEKIPDGENIKHTLFKEIFDIFIIAKGPEYAQSLLERQGYRYFDKEILLERLAQRYYQNRDFSAAASIYEKILETRPLDKDLIRRLADLYNGIKDFDKALEFYNKLLELEPDNAEITGIAAGMYKSRGDYHKAAQFYSKIKDKDGLLGLREEFRKVSDYKAIIDIYETLSDMEPQEQDYLIFAAELYIEHGMQEQAVSCYQRSIDKDRRSIRAYIGLGTSYLKNGKFSKADEYFKEALDIDPGSVEAVQGIAESYLRQGDFEAASKFYARLKSLDPIRERSYLGLGLIYIKQGRFDEAIKEFEEAKKMRPDSEEICRGMEWALREKSRHSLSISGSSEKDMTEQELVKLMRPRFCALGITSYCNFKCRMCHIWENKRTEGLSISQWKSFLTRLKDIAEEHCQINFAGGEPFMKKGLTQLIRHASDLGFDTAVCTNAYLIDEDMARSIGESGLQTIALSLDSLDEKKHDFLRGVKGSYSRVMNAIDFLNKYAPKTELNVLTIILEENLDDLVPLAKWVKANDKLNKIDFLGLIQPRGEGKNSGWYNKKEYSRLWPQDANRLKSVMDELIKMKKGEFKNIGNSVSQLFNYQSYYTEPEKYIHNKLKCYMGYMFLSVNAKGDVSLCEEMDSLRNLSNNDICDIWFSKEASRVRQEISNCMKNCHQLINCCYEEEG